mmetsp:Transcript_15607/g.43130  ORF Transcript_15607/g.43130 Transcript_15607/m.43130 type:complete len:211 (+) Transcript_15607:101-733(+)
MTCHQCDCMHARMHIPKLISHPPASPNSGILELQILAHGTHVAHRAAEHVPAILRLFNRHGRCTHHRLGIVVVVVVIVVVVLGHDPLRLALRALDHILELHERQHVLRPGATAAHFGRGLLGGLDLVFRVSHLGEAVVALEVVEVHLFHRAALRAGILVVLYVDGIELEVLPIEGDGRAVGAAGIVADRRVVLADVDLIERDAFFGCEWG